MIEELKETAVRCNTFAEYLTARGLYMLAGANIWPWHKGYKQPAPEEPNCPYYGWEQCGFLKHIVYVPDSQVISLKELAAKVLGFTDQALSEESPPCETEETISVAILHARVNTVEATTVMEFSGKSWEALSDEEKRLTMNEYLPDVVDIWVTEGDTEND